MTIQVLRSEFRKDTKILQRTLVELEIELNNSITQIKTQKKAANIDWIKEKIKYYEPKIKWKEQTAQTIIMKKYKSTRKEYERNVGHYEKTKSSNYGHW